MFDTISVNFWNGIIILKVPSLISLNYFYYVGVEMIVREDLLHSPRLLLLQQHQMLEVCRTIWYVLNWIMLIVFNTAVIRSLSGNRGCLGNGICPESEKIFEIYMINSIWKNIASFFCLNIHLLIHQFIHSFVIYTLDNQFIHWFIYSFILSLVYSFIHLFIHSFINLLIYPFIHRSLHLLIH